MKMETKLWPLEDEQCFKAIVPAQQTKPNTYVNSVDPDETARNIIVVLFVKGSVMFHLKKFSFTNNVS